MRLVLPFLTTFVLAWASVHVVDAASLRAVASSNQDEELDADEEDRRLQTEWPPYYQAYRQQFPESNIRHCTAFLENKGITDPVDGTRCHKRTAIGDYTCLAGLQSCASEVVPTTDMHPTKICTCDVTVGLLTCGEEWDPCGSNAVAPPEVEVDVDLPPRPVFQRPPYWGKYKQAFPEANFEPCLFLEMRGITDPMDGEGCHKRTSDYTCVFGQQICKSDMVATTRHPEKTCKCDVATGKLSECGAWDPCLPPPSDAQEAVEEEVEAVPPPACPSSETYYSGDHTCSVAGQTCTFERDWNDCDEAAQTGGTGTEGAVTTCDGSTYVVDSIFQEAVSCFPPSVEAPVITAPPPPQEPPCPSSETYYSGDHTCSVVGQTCTFEMDVNTCDAEKQTGAVGTEGAVTTCDGSTFVVDSLFGSAVSCFPPSVEAPPPPQVISTMPAPETCEGFDHGNADVCPASQPGSGDTCSVEQEEVSCTWETDYCCGVCHPALKCKCQAGEWFCYFTEACQSGCDITPVAPSMAPACPADEVYNDGDHTCSFPGQQCDFITKKFNTCNETTQTGFFGDEGVSCLCNGDMYECDDAFANLNMCYPEVEAPGDEVGIMPVPDEAMPAPDEAMPAPDEAMPAPDEAMPAPDEAMPAPDEAMPVPLPCDGFDHGNDPLCPAAQPDGTGACSAELEGISCSWGTDECCGQCYSSFGCRCSGGEWLCIFADSCVGGCDYAAVDPDQAPPCPADDVYNGGDHSCSFPGQQCNFVTSSFNYCNDPSGTNTYGDEGVSCICNGDMYECANAFANVNFCITEIGIAVEGRPFTDFEGTTKMADAIENESQPTRWSSASTDESVTDRTVSLPKDRRIELAEDWKHRAVGEHSSIASFAAFAIALMTNQAPPDLVQASLVAAMDELRHAQVSFEMASLLSGSTIEPSALPASQHDFQENLTTLASGVAKEGCVDETLSALVLAASVDQIQQQDTADDPTMKLLAEKTTQIAKEEGNHSVLAWRTIHWICNMDKDDEACVSVAKRWFEVNLMESSGEARLESKASINAWRYIYQQLVPLVTKSDNILPFVEGEHLLEDGSLVASLANDIVAGVRAAIGTRTNDDGEDKVQNPMNCSENAFVGQKEALHLEASPALMTASS